MSQQDLFITRMYTHKGISVAVSIDLVAKKVALVERQGDKFKDKQWYFSGRTLEYMAGWQAILDAMKYAITEATKVLQEADDRDQEKFVKLLMALNKPLKKPSDD